MPPITTQRLQNQTIEYPRFKEATQVLAWLGAIQGQDYAGAKWSIGLRLPHSTDEAIEQAIAEQKIVRTWLMRGTLFLLAAEDLCWMLDLLAPRVLQGTKSRYRQLELDEETLRRSHALILKALEGKQQKTRRELFAVLEENGISTAGQRGIHILQNTSMNGLIFQGQVGNNNPYFMRIDEYFPNAAKKSREDALVELARRFFISRAPVTVYDFAWWAGITVTDARIALEGIRHLLIEESIAGETYYLPHAANYQPSPQSPSVYALSGFDEYLLGYKVRDFQLDPQHAEKVCPGGNGVFYPTIVADGQMIATWKRSIKKKSILIEVQPFESISEAELEAFSSRIQHFGDYHQLAVEVLAVEKP